MAKEPPADKKKKKVEKIGNYQLIRLIGRGGMGAVYEARVPGEEKRFALKVLLGAVASDSPFVERFKREAKATAKLDHPGIVQIHEFGRDAEQDRFFFVMDYIQGKPLDEVVEGRRLPVKNAVKAVIQVAEALHHAHEAGVVHRDIKPSNLILEKGGRVYITDFGIARDESAATLTAEGEVLGTPFYMSPEQAIGARDSIDRATDVYSLGVTLYELLTATTPFRGSDMNQLLRRIIAEDPIRPSLLNPEVPMDLDTVVMKAIRKEKGKRYPTCQDLADDLRRWLRGEEVRARNMTIMERTLRVVQRNRGASIMAMLAGVVLILALAGLVGLAITGAQRRAEEARQRLQRIDDTLADAQDLFKKGRLQEALDGFEKVLALDEKNVKAGRGAARVKRRLAAEEARRQAKKKEAQARTLVETGRTRRRAGDGAAEKRRALAVEIAAVLREEGLGAEGSRINRLRQDFARLGDEQEGAYREALNSFSAALFADPRNREAPAEMALVYLNRARAVFPLAVVEGDFRLVEKLFLSVNLHDREERHKDAIAGMERWIHYKRHVSLTVWPEDADLGLIRCDLEAGTESPPAPLRKHSLDLAPGSYVIRASKAGYVTARYPVFVERPASAEDLPRSQQVEVRMIPVRAAYQGMVYVASGPFFMGGLDVVRGGPRRKVTLEGYLIDRTEVTHAQYKRFIDHMVRKDAKAVAELLPKYDTQVKEPGNWVPGPDGKGYTYPEGWANRPLGGITWNAARAYAAFAGKRLPTHQEWEKAARGVDGRLYPWGNHFDENRCFSTHTRKPPYDPNAGWFILHPVDAEPRGASPYGCWHMSGNVAEWTGSDLHDHKVNRGGCVLDQYEMMRCGSVDNSVPGSQVGTLGFRCAMDPLE